MAVLRVAIAGGGTGGHFFPALAVAEALREFYGAEVLYIGARRGLERRLAGLYGLRGAFLDPPRLSRGLFELARFGGSMSAELVRALRVLKRFRADAVVGVGGYASFAPVLAAKLLRLPVLLLEQNAVPGRANRLLAHLADETHVQFRDSIEFFRDTSRVYLTGNPVRREIVLAARRRRPPRSEPTLLIVGGSQGARTLNDAFIGALPILSGVKAGIRVVLSAGRSGAAAARRALAVSGLEGVVYEFHPHMEELYSRADLIVSRAGATAISELAVMGLPCALVPYPFAADDHQARNAEALRRERACVVVEDSRLTGAVLAELAQSLLLSRSRRERLSRAIKSLARPAASLVVARRVAELAGAGLPAARRAA